MSKQVHLLFEVAGQLFALPVDQTERLFEVEKITRIPGCVPELAGATNYHGEILPVVATDRLLNTPKELGPLPGPGLVIRQGPTKGVLRVDKSLGMAELKGAHPGAAVTYQGRAVTVLDAGQLLVGVRTRLEQAWAKREKEQPTGGS